MEAAALDAQCQLFLHNHKISDFEEFYIKIKDDAQNKGFLLQKTNECLHFILMSKEHPLSVVATVAVKKGFKLLLITRNDYCPHHYINTSCCPIK